MRKMAGITYAGDARQDVVRHEKAMQVSGAVSGIDTFATGDIKSAKRHEHVKKCY
jgi:hypothetical protein